MFSLKNIIAVLFLFSLVITGCSEKDDPVAAPAPVDPFAGLTKISEGYAVGIATKVQIWSKTPLFTGYNNVYIAVLDSAKGTLVTDAHIHLNPMMDMGMMMHSSPYENPASTKAVNSLFPAQIVFVMASMGGTWKVNVEVHNHVTDLEGVASLSVTVADKTPAILKSLVAKNDSSKVFVSYLKPSSNIVGLNDFEVTIHRTKDMMTFTADSTYTVVVTPEMPSMGHGSPNNVNPTNSGKGHYKGKVNFSMAGDWRINLDIYKNGAVVDTTLYFDVTL
ncbi:MAG: FixH family protein [Bacteroidota bacterium]